MSRYKFHTNPYEHQRRALRYGWRKKGFAYLMEMGTGKTKVTIDNACALWDNDKIEGLLVLAPKSVYLNWIDELNLHAPPRYPIRIGCWNSSLGSKAKNELTKLIDEEQSFPVLLMNIEALVSKKAENYAATFLRRYATVLVVDESTMIKNPRAKRTRAVLRLGKLAPYRRILSGNPNPENPLELFTQMDFVQPGCMGDSFVAFRARHAVIRRVQMGPRLVPLVVGYHNEEDIAERMRPYAFRVQKSECLDLPEKIYERVDVPLTAEQKRHYKAICEEAITDFKDGNVATAQHAITSILRARQVCAGFLPDDEGQIHMIESNRMEALLEQIELAPGKALIWCHFIEGIRQVHIKLEEVYGAGCASMFYGKVKAKDRQAIVKEFQNPDSQLRFIVANRAAAFGLTLTEARSAHYYVDDWSLESRQQSEDRMHRIGLQHAALYVNYVAPNTIEEAILKSHRKKHDLGKLILENGPARYLRGQL